MPLGTISVISLNPLAILVNREGSLLSKACKDRLLLDEVEGFL
jgi:hypothetical protein